MKTVEITLNPVQLATDEAAIRQAIDQMAVAWNAGNAAAFAQCLTDDCDYVTFAGQHIKGRQANEQTHDELFHSWVLNGSTLHAGPEPATIAFLSQDVALVHSTGTVQLRFQKKPAMDRLSIQTTVLIKSNGDWKVRAFHNCRVQKPGLFQRFLMSLKRQ